MTSTSIAKRIGSAYDDAAPSLRVLMTLHHVFDRNTGAAGVTLAIARALRARGCIVDLFGFSEAFRSEKETLSSAIRFPHALALRLVSMAHAYDIIDASSGDAWLWAALKRPGSRPGQALIARSHGLEHTVDQVLREEVLAGRASLRPRYHAYHGGYRLWEVKQSIQRSDHTILLNQRDLAYVRTAMHVTEQRSTIVPHGVSDELLAARVKIIPVAGLKLAFIGTWIERKGTATIVEIARRLTSAGVDFDLALLGTQVGRDAVLSAFPPETRAAITVVPSFDNADLPVLLRGRSILLFASRAEGFGLALLEGMACGLTPLATPVGCALDVIIEGENGHIIEHGASGFTRALLQLADEPTRVAAMRLRAYETARRYRWDDVARRTIGIYRDAIARSQQVRIENNSGRPQ